MGVINTGLVTKGLRSDFFSRIEQAQPFYPEVSTRIESTSDAENYRWLGTTPPMREWGTGRLARGIRSESYSIENLKYEATIEVDRDEISDDQTGQIRLRIAELAERAAAHKDELLAQLLANGATAGFNSYDGVTFFSNAHVSGASGTQSNVLSFNAANQNAPTVEEFLTAMKEALAQLLNLRDDRGHPLLLRPSGLFCVVPPAMYLTALEAIGTTVINNIANVLAGAARVITMPYLTDNDRWYLLKSDQLVRPFIFQDREPLEFNALTDDSDEGFRREKYLFGVRARYRMAYGYWQNAVRILFI